MHQQVLLDEDIEDDTTCTMSSSKDDVILRRPTREETDRITTDMVAQVQTRGMLQRVDGNKEFRIFINKSCPKKEEVFKPKDTFEIKVKTINKKWDPKRADAIKNPKFQSHSADKGEDKS